MLKAILVGVSLGMFFGAVTGGAIAGGWGAVVGGLVGVATGGGLMTMLGRLTVEPGASPAERPASDAIPPAWKLR